MSDVRVFAYFDMKEYEGVRKWMQRHPEYSGAIFSNNGFYIAKFDLPGDEQSVAYFFHYFSQKMNVQLFSMKEINPWDVLAKFDILSYKPFEARLKSQDLRHSPGQNHDEEIPPKSVLGSRASELTTSAEKASQGASAPSFVSGSSGDQYDYWPE